MIGTLVLAAVIASNCPKPVLHRHHKTIVPVQSCAAVERPPTASAPAPEPEAITVVRYYESCAPTPVIQAAPLYTGGGGWPEGGGGWPAGGGIPIAGGGGFSYPGVGVTPGAIPTATEPRIYPAPGIAAAPEIGAGQMAGALTLLLGGLAVILQRKGRL
jgi:hypothetical protein